MALLFPAAFSISRLVRLGSLVIIEALHSTGVWVAPPLPERFEAFFFLASNESMAAISAATTSEVRCVWGGCDVIGRRAMVYLQQPAGGAPAPPLAANNKFFGRFEQDTRAPAMKLAASPENSQ